MKKPALQLALLMLALLLALSCTAPEESAPNTATVADSPADVSSAKEEQEPTSQEPAWLVDVAAEAGIDFEHVRAATPRFDFPEIMGGGAAWLDYDGDDDLDLYLVQSGDLRGQDNKLFGNKLFSNNGDGTFSDVTEAAGVGDTGYGMGAAVGDYDGDGDPDLYVTNFGPNVLYRNDGGTFSDVSQELGVDHDGWGASAGFADLDGDGDLDLFVVNYIRWAAERELECFTGAGQRDYCGPNKYKAPERDVLYLNDGRAFRDATQSAGLGEAFGYGLGLGFGDFNEDGRLDIFVANDAVANQLWMNQGGGRFVDEALVAGCAVNMQGIAEAGMGTAAEDLDQDGDTDLFVSHLREETNTLYLNNGGLFDDATVTAGLAAPSLPHTGFGLGFADLDHDGWLDLFMANGKVRDPDFTQAGDIYAEADQLYRGTGAGTFQELPGVIRGDLGSGRAAAFADYDEDGDLDVVVVANGGKVALYQNQVEKQGHWVSFKLVDPGRDTTGARVVVRVGERELWRTKSPVFSYCSSNDSRVHFGLGSSTTVDTVFSIEDVSVIWVDGRRESFGSKAADNLYTLRRGDGST